MIDPSSTRHRCPLFKLDDDVSSCVSTTFALHFTSGVVLYLASVCTTVAFTLHFGCTLHFRCPFRYLHLLLHLRFPLLTLHLILSVTCTLQFTYTLLLAWLMTLLGEELFLQ